MNVPLKRLPSSLAIGIIASIIVVIAPVRAAADPASNSILGISPVKQEIKVKSGQSYTGKLTIINDGSAISDINLSASPYGVKSEDYTPVFDAKAMGSDVSSWFTFQPSQIQLGENKRMDIGYTINVPSNVPSGGYYAIAFAETSGGAGGSLSAKKRVGCIFFLTIDGPTTQQGSVASWSVPFWQITKPLTTTLRLKNSGNVHYFAKTQIIITDLFGNKKFVKDGDFFVLPNTVRKEATNWDKAPDFGIFKVSGTVSIFGTSHPLPSKMVLMLNATAFAIIFLALSAIAVTSILLAKQKR